VLQRGRPITVWGWAAPGETVTVSLGTTSASATATADPSGRWTAALPPLPAGGPYELTARAGGGVAQTAHDVLLGDVFLCSGQSNMVIEVRRSLNTRVETLEGNHDSIRMLTVPLTTSMTPLDSFSAPVKWQPASSATVPEFSAACYYFARELQKTVQVPLGLITSAWGGTTIQPWMSENALHAVGGYEQFLRMFHEYATDQEAANRHWGEQWESWWRDRVHTEPWRASSREISDWRVAPQPLVYWELWGVPELANFDGLVWYRTTVTLTAKQAAQSATLTLGPIDQIDATWLNGRWLGTTSGSDKDRTYKVARGSLRKGENTITVNVLDTYSYGGMYGSADKRALHLADGTVVPLDNKWRYEMAPSVGPAIRAPWEDTAGVTLIRNAMIAPIGPYGLRGVLWYQGESNADDAPHYQSLLEGLISDWRAQFGHDLPVLVVQLANYGPAVTAPTASDWAALREAQRVVVARDPHAALAVAIDIGERTDIHPANKQELGRRLARAARHVVYGESITPSGPVPTAAHKDGTHVIVTFKDIGGGSLVAYGAYRPVGFELCAADQSSCRFVDATLQSDRVVLEPAADEPTSTRVRFCWADSPVCNLYDKSGLPAGPFELRID
jgi:sialate O-acetylesterase